MIEQVKSIGSPTGGLSQECPKLVSAIAFAIDNRVSSRGVSLLGKGIRLEVEAWASVAQSCDLIRVVQLEHRLFHAYVRTSVSDQDKSLPSLSFSLWLCPCFDSLLEGFCSKWLPFELD